MKKKGIIRRVSGLALSALLLFSGVFGVDSFVSRADGDGHYTREAKPVADSEGYAYPGIYEVKAVPGDDLKTATLGIPSIAKQNLENGPTKESPAIIMGAAVPYEVKTGTTEFTPIPGGRLYAPYSYFRYKIIEEANPGGAAGTHKKMSGFDGSYVIIRVDVADLIKNAPEGSYLHVKQEGNKTLMVLLEEYIGEGVATFADATGDKSGSYALANGAIALKDKDGGYQNKTYVDVCLFSSGTGVAGADTGSTDPAVITADVNLKFYVDQVMDYNPELHYDPQSTDAEHGKKVMAKYFDTTAEQNATSKASYLVKGSDLELEIVNDDANRPGFNGKEFWSLRKALAWPNYNASPIKMICEVPILEGLTIDGTGMADRSVIFDVNSFDIQIANHQTTGAAGLTVQNATLKIMDGFNTTGAELAVGNNATMMIKSGGKLIIDETCQLEVEYDAASTAPSGETTPEPKTYDCGIITIESGGEIENNGIFTIEGTEGKPVDPLNPSVRDVKSAKFYIQPGGLFTNNGCLLSYGEFFNMGTLVNNGRYADLIESNDPDKGKFTYHRGLQISWKDDVTQDSVDMGKLVNGADGFEETSKKNPEAVIENNGDIVLVPGILDNYAKIENKAGGNLYLSSVEEAVIPMTPTIDQPTVMEKRVRFGSPMNSFATNDKDAVLNNAGKIAAANIEIVSNGRTGTLTEAAEAEIAENLYLENYGTFVNSGSISLDKVSTYTEMTNTGNGTIVKSVNLNANADTAGKLIDETKSLTEVYSAKKTETDTANIWEYAVVPTLTVSPLTQNGIGGDTVKWEVTATAEEATEDTSYLVHITKISPSPYSSVKSFVLKANETVEVESPALPEMNGNIIYDFVPDGFPEESVRVTVKVKSETVNPPEAVKGLVYSGAEQALITEGYAVSGTKMQYRLGTDGEWGLDVPKAKDAGDYEVFYKLETEETERGSVAVSIEKKEATVSADDLVSKVGDDLKELTYSVSGVVKGEELAGISIKTNADKTVAGSYDITVSVTGENPNYTVSTTNGTYTVTDVDFVVVAKDNSGVFSDDLTYKGFNITLTVPQGATEYYSLTEPLTAANYETAGTTKDLFAQPSGAGTYTVYYYVVSADKTIGVGGSKQVFIDKAAQNAPDKLTVEPESAKGAGDGLIKGLTPREMEYRKEGSSTYEVVYYEVITVTAGKYNVRRIGDRNHYPSPDTTVEVLTGGDISVIFDSNGGSAVSTQEGLSSGDYATRPADPTYEGAVFAGWMLEDEYFDFNSPVLATITLKAHWTAGAPSGKTLTFTGAAQELAVNNAPALSNSYVEFVPGDNAESAPAEGWSTAIPTGTNVGTYYVWFRILDNGNEIQRGCITSEITPVGKEALANAIEQANIYLDSIRDSHASIASTLEEAVNAAVAVNINENATEEEIASAVSALNAAVEAAKEAVAREESEVVDEEAAKRVIDLINAIEPIENTDACAGRIAAAISAYDALNDSQKALVTNYQTLLDLIAKYNELVGNREIDYLDPLRVQLNIAAEQAQLTGAPQTVYYESDYALPYEFLKKLQENPLVTLEYTIHYNDQTFVTVICGSKVIADDKIPWYGPLWLNLFFGKQ